MKRYLSLALAILCLCLVACGEEETSVGESSVEVSSAAESEGSSMEVESLTPEITDLHAEKRGEAWAVIDSLSYTNPGRMGDLDGPAFAVYSKVGYNGASAVLDLQYASLERVMPDGRFVNAYAFFGVDVYAGEWWQNCVDVGFCRSGRTGKWHLFYNMYEPLNPDTPTWYESSVNLPDDEYVMEFAMEGDNYVRLTVTGKGKQKTDTVLVEVKGAKADGSNTALLFNAALDYPPDTLVDREGSYCEDFAEITLAHTDKGLRFSSLWVSELTLYSKTHPNGVAWAEEHTHSVGIWPDASVKGFDYSPTTVYTFDGTEYLIDFDMNR